MLVDLRPLRARRRNQDIFLLARRLGVDVHIDARCPVRLAVDDVGLLLRPVAGRRLRRLVTAGVLRCLALRRR